MRILYLESDTTQARKIHSQLLAYKGVHWELRHCTTTNEALEALNGDSIDVAMVGLHGDEELEGTFSHFLSACDRIPRVAIVDSIHQVQGEHWIQLGMSDALSTKDLSGEQLMRRLRLAIARHDRSLTEQELIQYRQIHRPILIGDETVESPELELDGLEMRTPSRDQEELIIAILKDRGTGRLLEDCGDEGVEVHVFRDLNSYLEFVRSHPNHIDCAIVEQDLFEREGLDAFRLPELRFPGPPLLLLTTDRSDAGAVTYVADCFEDCLPVHAATTQSLLRTIGFALARREQAIERLKTAIRNAPPVNDRRQRPRTGADRRLATRYMVTRPLLAIPVLPDGAPDRSGIREAFSVDFAAGGIGFQISNHNGIPSRNWVVGVECHCDDGKGDRFHFSNVFVRNISYPQGGVRMGTQFQTPDKDILRSEALIPVLDAETGRFKNRLSGRALEQWIEIGVLRPKILHRVQSCPECQGLVSNGKGCRECGSPNIRLHELIHHYACAHVGHASDFAREDELSCPKCLTRSLVTGSDFEVIHSHYACNQCGYEGSELEQVGTCIHCRLRFPSNLALEEEVYGYDVDRLDILALLDTAG